MAQRVNINVPLTLDSLGRQIVGQRIVDFIVRRTQQGLGINNRPFIGYSESYKNSDDFSTAGKSNTVNLTLTGDMLSDLQVLSHTAGIISIGYPPGSPEAEKAEWHRQPRPNSRTGSISPVRDFLGISEKDLNDIVQNYLAQNPVITEIESRAQREARALFNRTLDIFGGTDDS